MNKISSTTNSAKAEANSAASNSISSSKYYQYLKDNGVKVGDLIDYQISADFAKHELVSFDEVTEERIATKGSKSLLPFLLRNASIEGVSCYPAFKENIGSQEDLFSLCSKTLSYLQISYDDANLQMHCKVYLHFLQKKQEAQQVLKEGTAKTAE